MEWKQTSIVCKSDILSDKLLVMVKLIDQIDTQITGWKYPKAEWSSNRTPANYFSAYVYAGHFIFGVLVRRAI